MAVDDKLRVLDPDLLRTPSRGAGVPDPTATAPLADRRDDRGTLPPLAIEELFDGSQVDPAALAPPDDGVPRRWDATKGAWVAPEGLAEPNTYAVDPKPAPSQPLIAAPANTRPAIPLDAVAYGAVVGALLFLILAFGVYLLV